MLAIRAIAFLLPALTALGVAQPLAAQSQQDRPDDALARMVAAASRVSGASLEPVEWTQLAGWMAESLRETDPGAREAILACEARASEQGPSAAPDPAWPLARAWDCARQNARGVSPDQMATRAIRTALHRLDPRSTYHMDIAALTGQAQATTGLGVHGLAAGGFEIVSVARASSAAETGIRIGDQLLEIDGQPVARQMIEDVWSLMQGPEGSIVAVVTRPSHRGEPVPSRLERRLLRAAEPGFASDDGVLVVAVQEMGAQTEPTVRARLEALGRGPAGRPSAILLDLRGSTGGLLESAVAIADLFLDEGTILTVREREPGQGRRFASRGDLARHLPVYVLVDRGTSAGAEVVAAALSDHRRARIIGERTMGAGGVRTVLPIMEDGGVIIITTGQMIRPDGRPISAGVEPDIVITEPATAPAAGGRDVVLDRALETIRSERASSGAAD